MNAVAEKTIRIDKALEFAVFSDLPLHVFTAAKPDERIALHVHDVTATHIVVKLAFAATHNLKLIESVLSQGNLTATLSYKQKLLTFPTRLIENYVETSATPGDKFFTLEKPDKGNLVTRRSSPRVHLTGSSEALRAVITISSLLPARRGSRHLIFTIFRLTQFRYSSTETLASSCLTTR